MASLFFRDCQKNKNLAEKPLGRQSAARPIIAQQLLGFSKKINNYRRWRCHFAHKMAGRQIAAPTMCDAVFCINSTFLTRCKKREAWPLSLYCQDPSLRRAEGELGGGWPMTIPTGVEDRRRVQRGIVRAADRARRSELAAKQSGRSVLLKIGQPLSQLRCQLPYKGSRGVRGIVGSAGINKKGRVKTLPCLVEFIMINSQLQIMSYLVKMSDYMPIYNL